MSPGPLPTVACTLDKQQEFLGTWLTLIPPLVCSANSNTQSQWPFAHRGFFGLALKNMPVKEEPLSEIGIKDLPEEGRIWQQNEFCSHLMKDPLQKKKKKVQKLSIRGEMKPSTLAYTKWRLFLLKNSISLHDEICSSSLGAQ